jgi:hypothetical protein
MPHKKDTSDNIKSISDVPDISFKSKAEDMLKIVQSMSYQIEVMSKAIKEKDDKIFHLENMLSKSVPIIGSPEYDEVSIAKEQLKRIGHQAYNRELTSDEARRFEIFSKVIQNSEKGQSKSPSFNRLRDVSPDKLLDVAAKVMTLKPSDNNGN